MESETTIWLIESLVVIALHLVIPNGSAGCCLTLVEISESLSRASRSRRRGKSL
jgi:hypothetical protein